MRPALFPDTVPDVPDPDLPAVDRNSPAPLAGQVTAILRAAVESGELAGRLPNEDKLCEILQVSRGTLREGMSPLVREGLITRWPRRGTWANRPPV